MNTADTYVQPIVLLVDKTDPAAHTDAIRAAASASVAAYAHDLAAGADLSSWELWLDGPFTKSVRRADAKTFAKLAATYTGQAHVATTGKARALAFSPAAYEDLPKAISRLQVSGTELPERGSDAVSVATQWNIPTVVMNGGLGMSTGKASAQAAHALFAWFLTLDSGLRDAWESTGRNFHLHMAGSEEFADAARDVPDELLIEDAGRTEIEPGTATAFVAPSRI
jgi:peptidyl-tRNA hydrolase